jgi:hypothetical protein
MTQIARVYDDAQSATAAANELRKRRLGNVAVVSAPPNDTQQASNPDYIVAAIREAGFRISAADTYADRVKRGGSVVIVDAAFGTAATAIRILERHGPGETVSPGGAPAARPSAGASARNVEPDTAAAPLSAALRLPVLTGSTPSASPPGSATTSAMLGVPELMRSGSSFPLLTENQDGWSSLAHSQKPFSSLTASQKPLSTLAHNQNGAATLIDNPAPLSSLLGLPVLIGQRADTSAAVRAADPEPPAATAPAAGVDEPAEAPTRDTASGEPGAVGETSGGDDAAASPPRRERRYPSQRSA